MKRGRKPIENIEEYEKQAEKFKQEREELIRSCLVLTDKGRMKLRNQISAMESRVRLKKETANSHSYLENQEKVMQTILDAVIMVTSKQQKMSICSQIETKIDS